MNGMTKRTGDDKASQASTLTLVDDIIVADFPYDSDLVAEIKCVPSAKWDKVAKVWRTPLTSLRQMRDFAIKYDFIISNEILAFDIPDHKNPGDGLSIRGKYVYLSFKYDPVMVRSVKQIEGITWDSKTKAWKAPMTAIETVVKWATTFKVDVPNDVRAEAERVSATQSERRSASREVDAEIDIPGLQGTLLPYQRAGVAYASTVKRTFIADEMGLGKTLQAIATLENLHLQREDGEASPAYPAVVVCPTTLVLNWKN